MVVEDSVVLEQKATAESHPIYEAQVLTYLRLGCWKVGLILSFNRSMMRDGMKRVVLSL